MSWEGFTDRDLLIEVLGSIEEMKKDLRNLEYQIHGNGQPGIKDRLSRVETKLDERTGPSPKALGLSGMIGAGVVALAQELFGKFNIN